MRVFSKNRLRFTNGSPDDYHELQPGEFQDIPANWEGIKDTPFFQAAVRDGSIVVLDSSFAQQAQEKELEHVPSYAEVMEQMRAQEESIDHEVQAQIDADKKEESAVDDHAEPETKSTSPKRQRVVG